MKKYSVIDLFAGAGGLSEGFMETGMYEFIAHVEWEYPMVNTLRTNLIKRWGYSKEEATKSVVLFDVQKTDQLLYGNWDDESIKQYGKYNSELVVKAGLDGIANNKTVDIIIGGPPCQAYSIAGRAQDPNSMKLDYRNYLFESFVKVVDHFKPKVFVFENVPGILSAKPGDKLVIERIYEAFDSIGYEIRSPKDMKKSVYLASDYQVPQDRRRVIIFGVLKESNFKLEDFYSSLNDLKSRLPKKTVKDAIGDLPEIMPLKDPYRVGNRNISHEQVGFSFIPLHEARYHNKRDIDIFREWIAGSMNNLSTEEKLKYYTEKTGKISNHNKYRSLEWDKPSPTIVSHLYKDGLMFIHPDYKQARSITIREAALLQTFPIDYEFVGSNVYCFKMIGNAVPVMFSKNIGYAIAHVFENRKKKVLNVLVACEESQRVCSEFRRLGHNAFSCDLLECSGGHPEWHFKQDVLSVIEKNGGTLENGEEYYLDGKWDLMVAHPPCTYLAVSGAKWFYHPEDKHLPINERRPHPSFPNRAKDREAAEKFFLSLANADIEHIAIENPVGIMNTKYRKPDQIIQPYFFGDPASKKTCLWLKNLPPLIPTDVVEPGEFIEFKSGRKLAKWYSDALTKTKSAAERQRLRSKTFPGFAKAIAEQWSEVLVNEDLH